ncbi:CHAD domain-containing protein [Pseudomonas sp. NA-150]|uniref:CHAD domain-containing protein n=1 Tax=Pseudomonas sp. NA-150 TaxID=3367525 RepID=UPI0037CC2790
MSGLVDHLIAQLLALEVRLMACQARLVANTDNEALHDLRIAVRRLRSLLRPLHDVPGTQQLELAAKDIGDLTTPLRDREVLAAYLKKLGMTDAAQRRGVTLGNDYRDVAGSDELARLFSVLEAFPRFLRASQHQGLLHDLHKRIDKRLEKQWKKLDHGINDPAHDRHRLRLLIKRVRYADEAYPEFSHHAGKKAQVSLKAAQGALGDWHDHLQWLVQAQEQPDLAPCKPRWEQGIVRAELEADQALERLAKTCFTH